MKFHPFKILLVAAGLLLLSGCASLGPQFSGVATVPSGKALVYLYRPNKFAGGGASYLVHVNDTLVTRLYNNGYYAYVTDPGETRVWAKTETTASVTLDLKPGDIRYVRGGVGMGIIAPRPRLTVVSNTVGRSEIATCKLLPELTKEDREKANQ